MILVKPSFKIESELDPFYIIRHIEKAIKKSYKLEKENSYEEAQEYIRKRIRAGHTSVIEHFSFSVSFIVNRGFTHEIVRHRLASFTQESTRYCNYSKDRFGHHLTFIIPPWLNLEEGEYVLVKNNTSNVIEVYPSGSPFMYYSTEMKSLTVNGHRWLLNLLKSEEDYMDLIKDGWKPEQARDILPHALKTEIFITANLKEWRWIFHERYSKAAHPQMIEMMGPLLEDLKNRLPVFFEDINIR